MRIAVFLILVVAASAGCKICKLAPFAVIENGNTITFGKSEFPCYKVNDLQKAEQMVVKAIYSDEFKQWLKKYIKDSIGNGLHAAAWEGLDADKIVKQMREGLNGISVDTYGGIKGTCLLWFKGNLAFDGSQNGPILINRVPLRKRTVAELANTIAHEVSHRIGLEHPNSKTDLRNIGVKEPPYVIGNRIEKIVQQYLEN